MSSEIARVVISKVLGEYLENIDSENIAVGLWSGFVSLENVLVKPSAFDKFNLPIKILYGKVDKIEMSIPYKSILMGISSSVEIFIDNIKIFIKSNGQENWDFFDYTEYEYKKNLIKSFTEDLLLKIKISENPKINNTYVNRMVNNIIDNIKIKINNFIVINEDEHSHPKFNFHLGIQCKEISINSIQSEENTDTNYSNLVKEFKLLEFSIFMIPYEKNSENKINYDFTIGNKIILNDLNNKVEEHSKNFIAIEKMDRNTNLIKLNEFYIIKPINLKLTLKRNSDNTKYKINIEIDSIEIELERKQFACILKNLDFINKYTQFYNNCYFYRKFKFFKPELELIDEKNQNLSLNKIREQNRLLKKNYNFKFLRHYFNQVYKLIKEKRLKGLKNLFMTDKQLQEFKKYFTQNYTKYYLDESSLNMEEFKKMKEIVKYVDKEILYEWIKDFNISEIYKNLKIVEEHSGFMGGLKSYFYTSAVDTIKYDEGILKNVKSDEFYINLNFKIKLCGLSISEVKQKNLNKIKESSKFLIKDTSVFLNKNSTKTEDSLFLELSVNEFKMTHITKMNESNFIDDIIMSIMKFSDKDKILILNLNKNKNKSVLFINLFSQAFVYKQKFIENLIRFFNISEFDQISNLIKTTEIINLDLNLLQKYNIDKNNLDDKISDNEMILTILVNNQKLIFPYKNAKDFIIINLGDFSLKNSKNIYEIESTKMNIEYEKDRNLFKWLEEIKNNKIESENLITNFSILNEFSLNLKITSSEFMDLECTLSEIDFNLNNHILKRLMKFSEIFELNYDSDIWESVYENKMLIFNNCSKRGNLILKEKTNILQINDNWNKYFCLLSGGYLYLFEKPENLKAVVLISLKNASLREENSEFLEIYYNKSKLNYTLGFTSENIMRDWKKSIQHRIDEIRSYQDEKENSLDNYSTIDNSYVIIGKEKIESSVHLEKIKNAFNLFKNRNNLKEKLKFVFKLNRLGLNLHLDSNEIILEEKFLLEFKNFNLNVIVNELLLNLNFELSEIKFSHFIIEKNGDNIYSNLPVSTNILSNKLYENEKLINIKVLVYNTENFEIISNVDNIKLIETTYNLNNNLENIGTLNFIKNISKIDIQFILSNMSLVFNPKVIKNLLKFINNLSTKENLELKDIPDKDLINENILPSEISSDTTSLNSERFNDLKINLKFESNLANLKLSALFKSLDLEIINKKTNFKIFSFSLGESQFDIFQFYHKLEVKLNLGNFQLNDHLSFTENVNSSREILGLANKNKNSSLNLNMIIYNKDFYPIVDNKIKHTMKIDILFESIKINYIHKIIMRIIDCVNYDIISVFENENKDKINDNLQIKLQENPIQNNINKVSLINANFYETFDLNIQINNPTIILFDVLNENLFYQLDFGTIFIKNSLHPIQTFNFYYDNYEIEFKDTNIQCSDNFNICEPMSIKIVLSFLKNLNENYLIQVLDSELNLIQNILQTNPETEIKIYVQKFDFVIRKLDYLNIFKLIKNNFDLDDNKDEILFDKIKIKLQHKNGTDNIKLQRTISQINPQLNKFKLNLKFYNDIFKIKLLNEDFNFIQLLLTNCDFNFEKFVDNQEFKISSKNIFVKDNSISVISNIKGLDKLINIKNYAQFNFVMKEDFINKESIIDLSMIDLKILLKLDLISFIQNFIKIEKDEIILENKNDTQINLQINNEVTQVENQNINNDYSKMIINIAILNNVIFLKSENNFSAQEILACEGDITTKINLIHNNNYSKLEFENIEYEIQDNFDLNFALQNFHIYTAKILSFESDFENLYNKRKIFEPINLYANLLNRNILNKADNKKFTKNEIFLEIDLIKMKVSYQDFFFIYKSIMMNIENLSNLGKEEKNIKIDKNNKVLNTQINKLDKNINNNSNNKEINKFENSLELFVNLKSIEIFIINDLNDMFCPILQLIISNVNSTLFIDLFNDINLKTNCEILINYFNYKISIWEPLLEKFEIISLIKKENKIINIKSALNFNITEEFIFLMKNSIESFKIDYKKEISQENIFEENNIENVDENSVVNVSNHVLINYSGDDIIIQKTLLDNSIIKITIKNGDSYDINNIFKKNHHYTHYDLDSDFTLSQENVFDYIKFKNKNLSIQNFILNSTNELNEKDYSDQIQTLINSDIFYNVELYRIRRNYIFYGKIILENHTDLKILNLDENDNQILLKPFCKFGIENFDHKLKLKIDLNGKNYLINFRQLLNNNHDSNGYNFMYFEIGEVKLSLLATKQTIREKDEIIILKIHPTFIINNFLTFPIKIKSQNFNNEFVLKSSNKRFLYCDKNFNINNFKYEYENLNDLFITESIEEVKLSESEEINYNSVEKTQIIKMKNSRNSDQKFIFKLNYINEHGIMKIFLYADYLIINTTPYDIFPIVGKEKVNELSNFTPTVKFINKISNEKIFIYSIVENYETCQLNLKEENKFYRSKKFEIFSENYAFNKEIILVNLTNEIDDTNFDNLFKNQNLPIYQFVIERYIKYLKFTTLKKIDILMIKPRFIIKNNLNKDIMIYHKSENNFAQMIKKNSEEILHLKNSLINFKIIVDENNSLTNESEFFYLEKVFNNSIILNKNEDDKFYLNIVNSVNGLSFKLIINESNFNNSSILIENKVEDVIIKMYQITKESNDYMNEYILNPNETKFLNWTKNLISKYIKIDIIDKNDKILDYHVLDYDTITNNKNEGEYLFKFNQQKDLMLKVIFDGDKQRFIFEKISENKDENNNSKNQQSGITLIKIISQLILNINEINISIINFQQNKRSELTNLNINKISLIYIEEIRNNKDKFKTIEIKLKEIQIDNLFIKENGNRIMTQNSLSPYKVNLFKINEINQNMPFIHLITEIKENNQNKMIIEKLEFLIQSFGICLDSEILHEILKFSKSLQINISDSLHYKNIEEILKMTLENNLIKSVNENIKDNDKILINYLRTSPINFLISYKNISDKLFDELNIKSSFIKNIIEVFTSNDKVNIQLKAIEMNKVLGNGDQILEKILDYYKYNLISQSLKLVFSIDILGNPLNLLQNLSSGVKDFFFLPVQGIINGPFEFIYGSISGTRSLVSHTIGGALDSTEKITSTLGKKLLKLSNSEDYIKERQNLYLDPKSKFNKFSTSLKIIFLGMKYGMKDFLTFPYIYMKNQGIIYLPKGLFLGTTSLFVKPVSGLLDFLSFFSGGLSKQFLQNYEITLNNLHRKRNNRIFWGSNKYIKADNLIINSMVKEFDSFMNEKEFFEQIDNVNSFYKNRNVKKLIFYKENNNVSSLIFVNDFIFVLDAVTQIFTKVIPIDEIEDFIIDNLKVKILYKNRKIGLSKFEFEMTFDEEKVKDNFINYVLLIWNKK